MSNRVRIVQFLRFCTVGCANTAIDFSTFFVLNLIGIPHLVAQVLAYSAGVANSFVLNRKWTFNLKGKTNSGEVFKFVAVNSISLLVSTSLLYFMCDSNHMNLWLAKAVATIGGIIINYAGSRIWVFSGNQPGWQENTWRLSERTR